MEGAAGAEPREAAEGLGEVLLRRGPVLGELAYEPFAQAGDWRSCAGRARAGMRRSSAMSFGLLLCLTIVGIPAGLTLIALGCKTLTLNPRRKVVIRP